MKESFVSKIWIKNTAVISDFQIPLSDQIRKHLILTGKNGSGKTTVLQSIHQILEKFLSHPLETQIYESYLNEEILRLNERIIIYGEGHNPYKNHNGSFVGFTNFPELIKKVSQGKYIFAFFDAKRNTEISTPSGINKVNQKLNYNSWERASTHFIQYLVNLKAEQSFALNEGELEVVEETKKWFLNLENSLKDIFDSPSLKLRFDRKQYNFNIIEDNKSPYTFQSLSAGYSSILSIVSELIMRMEAHQAKSYDMEGLVIIDELETHLHVDLQKKIFPFLTNFFPRIQFIISTHSPFVLSSISNSVVCDLEKQILTENLSGYSYHALIESYFGSDQYSNILKNKVLEYEVLASKKQLNEIEEEELEELEDYFNNLPKIFSPELEVKLQQIKLKSLNKEIE